MARVLIVGGGITGLSAAFYLQRKAPDLKISLMEQSNRLGGKIQTERADGFIMELGPDSILSRKQAIVELIKDLELQDEVVGTNPFARKNYIYRKNKLHAMPQGLNLGIPTQLAPFVKTDLISPLGKLRAGLDLLLPARQSDQDESLGSFLTRRLGKEVAQNIAEPLLSGIYAGDTDRLSIKATFPQFRQQEIEYGSLIKGITVSRKHASPAEAQAEKSVFINFKNGLATLVERLEETLSSVQILLNEKVKKITRSGTHYLVSSTNLNEVLFDYVVLAIPAYEAKRFLPDMPEIPYVSVANILFGYLKEDIHYSLEASGFVVPRTENLDITACTWTSSKWSHTAPEDYAVVRCYIGHAKDQRLLTQTDEDLVQMARKDLLQIMGIDADPVFHKVTRLHNSMPQYLVGHLDRLSSFGMKLEATHPNLYVAGAGYLGVGIPDCIAQGKAVASEIIIKHCQEIGVS